MNSLEIYNERASMWLFSFELIYFSYHILGRQSGSKNSDGWTEIRTIRIRSIDLLKKYTLLIGSFSAFHDHHPLLFSFI